MKCIFRDAAGFGSIQVIRQPVFGFLGHPIEINKRAARLFSTLEYATNYIEKVKIEWSFQKHLF